MCDNTGCNTAFPLSAGETGEDEKWRRSRIESDGRAVVIAPSALGSKEQSSGAFPSPAAENPLGGVSAVEDPSAESGGEGSVASSRHDKSPEFPKGAFQKRCLEGRRGFDISPRRVGSGTLYPQYCCGIHIIVDYLVSFIKISSLLRAIIAPQHGCKPPSAWQEQRRPPCSLSWTT